MHLSMRRRVFGRSRVLAGISLLFWLGAFGVGCIQASAAVGEVEFWLTDPAGSARFELQEDGLAFSAGTETDPAIVVDAGKTYQTIDGFGCSLTGGSAQHLIRMDAGPREALLKELFGTDGDAIGMSYLRVSIGASDLNEKVFSYNDLPAGETDYEMKHFDLGPDREDVIPVLREILEIAPDLKIMGSPWSPPTWMKTNGRSIGGSLKPECYDAYAKYFVRYVQEMAKEGIRIDAITVQNEPLHPGNNPSLLMPAAQQAEFIRNHLGPAFTAAKIDTKIVIYDHNCDRPDYPISILDDPEANKYIDGSAFHLYGGRIEAMSAVHEAHPDKNLYFTEQWIGAPGNLAGDLRWHVRELVIGATRNWSRTVLEWNLAANSKNQPHTPGGCTRCLGAVTIDGNEVTRNPAYYILAHAAKFVRPGSVRIDSNPVDGLPNVAFQTPDGRKVLIVLNDTRTPRTFSLRDGAKTATSTLPAGAVGTFIWQ